MKDNIFKKIKPYFITIWLVAAVLSVVSIISYAAYTSTHTAKSVISTRGSSGSSFSSNYLVAGAPENIQIGITVPSDSVIDDLNPVINLTVCNYPQDNPAKYYTDNIEYDLQAVLMVRRNGSYEEFQGDYSDYYITYKGTDYHFENSPEINLSCKLQGYEQSTDNFDIHFPSSQLDSANEKVFVYVKANPRADYSRIEMLSAYISITPKEYEQPTVWSGSFSDSTSFPPYEYDAFNYVISGTGKEKIKLSWNTDYLNISRWFIEETGATVQTDGNKKYIEFDVDSSLQNIYNIQFYRRTAPDKSETWETFVSYVTFETVV